MPRNEAEELTRGFLESEDFEVDRIPVAHGERRADFRVSDQASTYIVEVKGRTDDEAYLEELRSKGHAFSEDLVGRTNPVSRQICDAADQLAATPMEPGDFQLISLVVFGRDFEVQAAQFEATLYGAVDLITRFEDGNAIATPCYYFAFNEFFRLRQIAAALLLIPEGTKLCLNTFCSRIGEFRKAALCQRYSSRQALCDPGALEEQGTAFIADCGLDRRSESEVLDYVKKKYDLERVIKFQPTQYKAGVAVDYDDHPD